MPLRSGVARRLVASEKLPQSLHLLTPAERNHFRRNGPLLAPDHRPEIAGAQDQPSHDERILRHLIKCSANFPDRMPAESVVLSAGPESRRESTVLGEHYFPLRLHVLLPNRP